MKRLPIYFLIGLLCAAGVVLVWMRNPGGVPDAGREASSPSPSNVPAMRIPVPPRIAGAHSPVGVPPSPVASTTAEIGKLPQMAGAKVSEHVTIIIGDDSMNRSYLQRATALKKLTRQIGPNDLQSLMVFLDTRLVDQKEMSVLQFNSLKNDVLDVLIKQDTVPEGLGTYMVRMYKDATHDDTWRDYCIQYMAPYHQRKWEAGKEIAADEERSAITNALWEAAGRHEKSTAGTAMIGLQNLAENYPDVDKKQLGDLAAGTASDERAVEGARITAFSISSMLGRSEVLPAARIVAQTGETVVLQMAAIRVLGDLGEARDQELLRSLAAGKEKRVVTLAAKALTRLQERLKSAQG